MKKLVLAVTVCCVFSMHVVAMDTSDNYKENYVLRTLIKNDKRDIEEVIRNSYAEADKALFEADMAYCKAGIKVTQSRKVFVTKADALKMCSIEADKARIEAYEAYSKFRAARSAHDPTSKFEELSALCDAASANASKMRAVLLEIKAETTKSNSNEAVSLYNRAAKFYDKTARAYGKIVAAYSINTVIIKAAEKVKGSKDYDKYEAYIAEKKKAAEAWVKHETYAKKLKAVAEAYARVATVRIELANAVKTYAKAAKTYDKAAKVYTKVAKHSTEIPETDMLSCFKFEDAVDLHKAHKISDVQLASIRAIKASNDTVDAYATYCRTSLKLTEAIVAAYCAEDEVAKLKTELGKSLVEQAQDIVQCQAEGLICY